MFLTVDNSENEFNKKARLKVETKLTVGKQDAKCGYLGITCAFFYLCELKVCRMVGLCIPNNRMLFVFRFLWLLARKWRHKIYSKIKFQLMA